jgi:hypothetical protein
LTITDAVSVVLIDLTITDAVSVVLTDLTSISDR